MKAHAHDAFSEIKDNIEQAYEYFKPNYERYHNFVNFIYNTTLSDNDKAVLQNLGKPELEFNVVEAYISRLCGEFSKMDPAFEIKSRDNVNQTDSRINEVVEAHIKAAFKDGDQSDLAYQLYKDMLSGGFSVAEVYTDYPDEYSMDQNIYVRRVFDPTLCGFDPLARQRHKGDGRYCFQLFPMAYDEAVQIWGEEAMKPLKHQSYKQNSFNWSYSNQNEKIVMIAEYFCKTYKRKKIVQLTNGHVIEKDKYNKMIEQWNESGNLEQPAVPIKGKERMTNICQIEKYTICGSQVLDHVENTNFDHLPLVFFDGNSEIIRGSNNGQVQQMTRPYIYNAKDTQRFKNFAGQTLAHEIENMIQHKWKAPIEGIPNNEDFLEAYRNPQQASVILYNQYKDNDPNKPVNPPQEVQRVPIPNEVPQAFMMADQTIQGILGSYDATIGVNDKDISGKAIQQGAMQSNAAAMPYTVGFLKSWERCAEIYLNLLPKYYVTPRTIPIIKKNGKKDVYQINQGDNVRFNYETRALSVKVEPGVSFSVQKEVALNSIIQLMQASEQFKQFMNEQGLEVLLDNLEIRGIDSLKAMAEQFMKQQKQQQQQMMQQQQQQPTQAELAQQQMQLKEAELAQKGQESQQKLALEAEKLRQKAAEANQDYEIDATKAATDASVKQQDNEIKFMELLHDIEQSEREHALKEDRINAEQTRSAVDMAMNLSQHAQELYNKNETSNMEDNDNG